LEIYRYASLASRIEEAELIAVRIAAVLLLLIALFKSVATELPHPEPKAQPPPIQARPLRRCLKTND